MLVAPLSETNMQIGKTFEQWLQKFDSRLRIMELQSEGKDPGRANIDVLYLGKERLCSVPKGLKKARDWNIDDALRSGSDHKTDDDIVHRTLTGIGHTLLLRRIINPRQFIEYFISSRNKEILRGIEKRGSFRWKGLDIPLKDLPIK